MRLRSASTKCPESKLATHPSAQSPPPPATALCSACQGIAQRARHRAAPPPPCPAGCPALQAGCVDIISHNTGHLAKHEQLNACYAVHKRQHIKQRGRAHMLAGARACISQRFQELAQRPAQRGRALADLQRAAGGRKGAWHCRAVLKSATPINRFFTRVGYQPASHLSHQPLPHT